MTISMYLNLAIHVFLMKFLYIHYGAAPGQVPERNVQNGGISISFQWQHISSPYIRSNQPGNESQNEQILYTTTVLLLESKTSVGLKYLMFVLISGISNGSIY